MVVKHQELVLLVESVGARRRDPKHPDKHHPRKEARISQGTLLLVLPLLGLVGEELASS